MGAVQPVWATAFLDFAPDHFGDGVRFWQAVTGTTVSAARGNHDEFATLEPTDGDSSLRVQRLGDGEDRIHLDLHVEDVGAAVAAAFRLGARVIADQGTHVILASPAGLTFCLVPGTRHRRPPPLHHDGHTSALDQVCIDIPPTSYDEECGFWADLTGWALEEPEVTTPEFRGLRRPADHPLRILLQRLAAADDVVGAHLDWATLDRAAETERHVAQGASVVERRDEWTVLADPTGRRYCITDRDPARSTV